MPTGPRATQTAGGLSSMAVGGLPSWAAALLVRATASVRRVEPVRLADIVRPSEIYFLNARARNLLLAARYQSRTQCQRRWCGRAACQRAANRPADSPAAEQMHLGLGGPREPAYPAEPPATS
jgi:hypothetical protein